MKLNFLTKKNKIILFVFLLFPFKLFSLTNPFFFFYTFNVIAQILLSIILFIPFWIIHIKNKIIFYKKIVSKIILFLILIIISSAYIYITNKIKTFNRANLNIQYSNNIKTLGELSNIYKLNKDDIIIDIRLPRIYNLYHLVGSCNIDPVMILEKNYRERIEKESNNIYLVCEWSLHIFDYYNSLLSNNVSNKKWKILELGQLYYKTQYIKSKSDINNYIINKKINFDEAYSRRDENSNTIINTDYLKNLPIYTHSDIIDKKYRFINKLFYNFNPDYSKYWNISLAKNFFFWKELPVSVLFEKRPGLVKIFIDNQSIKPLKIEDSFYKIKTDNNIIISGFNNTNLNLLDKAYGKEINEVIFIFDNLYTGFTAESLALDLIERNNKIKGYILVDKGIDDILKNNTATNNIKDYVIIYRDIIINLLLFLLLLIINFKLEKFINLFRFIKMKKIYFLLDLFFRLFITFSGIYLFIIFNKNLSNNVNLNFTHCFPCFENLSTYKFSIINLIPIITYILLFINITKYLPCNNNMYNFLYIILSILSFVNSINFYIESNIKAYTAIIILSFLAIQNTNGLFRFIKFNLNSIMKKNNKFLLISLIYLKTIKYSIGEKTKNLLKLLKLGIAIPPGYLFITTINDFSNEIKNNSLEKNKNWIRIHKKIKKKFSKNKIIVRSSAPDEDITSNSHAGIYKSIVNIEVNELSNAIYEVLKSYKDNGIDPMMKVGILVQLYIEANVSGLAIRENTDKGESILVEASPESNILITSGIKSEYLGRIGGLSNKWISGNINNSIIKDSKIVNIFFLLEKLFKSKINIEFGIINNNIVIYQVRLLKYDILKLEKNTPAHILNMLKPYLLKNFYNNKTILDKNDFTDYQYGVTTATYEFINDLYSYNGPQSQICGIIYKILSKIGPEPSIIKLYNGLYLNLVAKSPFINLLLKPFIQISNLFIKINLKRTLLKLENDIIKAEKISNYYKLDIKKLDDKSYIVDKIIELKNLILQIPGKHIFEVALIMQACFRKNAFHKLKNPDPFLIYISKNIKRNKHFFYRSITELSLDLPRFNGDNHDTLLVKNEIETNRVFPERPNYKDNKSFILYLQALARDNLSYWVCTLRQQYLLLGKLTKLKNNIFNLTSEQLQQIGATKKIKLNNQIHNNISTPTKLTLNMLEELSTGENFSTFTKEKPFWVSGNVEFNGIITDNIDNFINNKQLILLLKNPSVDVIIKLPENSFIISLGGTRLCHASLIVKEKNIKALFNAFSYESILKPQNQIKIQKNGKIRLIKSNIT